MVAAAESVSPRRVKLRPPRLPGDVIVRPRLLARLNRMAALSLIVAPAGYGKTTLVGTWLAQLDLPSAWLSLDEGDNEPASFLAALTAAIAVIVPAFGVDILETLNSPNSVTFADLAVLLINELNGLAGDFILVVDDYHVIHEPAIHRLLVDLVTYPPQAMHLVLTTRHDPPLPWRIRSRGNLCELRAADLGFTEDEAEQFLAKASDRPVSGADARSLAEQSQGWITSLRLMALAMRLHAEEAGWSDMASAEFRNFNDYFASELLADLAPGTLNFLLRSSILELLSGPLCDFVVGAEPAESAPGGRSNALLRELESAGTFTVALDDEGTWYRYHPLLREVLRRQLRQNASAAEILGLYARASAWHEEHELLDEALAYALASGEMQRAVDFLQRHRHQLLDNWEWRRLARWLDQFPPVVIEGFAELVLVRAWINQWRYNLPEVRVDLERLEALLAPLPPDGAQVGEWRGEIATLHSQQCVAAGDAAGAMAVAPLALTSLPPSRFYVRTVAMVHLVWGCQMAGQWQRAVAFIEAFAAEDGVARDLAMARSLTLHAYVDLPTTNLAAIRAAYPKLLQLVSARGLKTNIAWAHYFCACTCYLQNDLHGAAEHFSAVLELVDFAHALAYTHSAIGLALTYQAQGMAQDATGVVKGATRILTARRQSYVLVLINAFAAELAARQGRLEEALRWVAREGRQFINDALPMLYLPGLAFVKVLLAGGTAANLYAAHIWLVRQLDLALATHNIHAQIQCHALAAALHEVQGDRLHALAALANALALAEHGQIVRVFADLAAELTPVFAGLAADKPLTGFAARVFSAIQFENQPRTVSESAAFPGMIGATLPADHLDEMLATADKRQGAVGRGAERDLRELLTYREMDVLRLLDKRLTNKEIAHLLGISTETVRQHTVNLFRKLNVGNRRQAIVVARSKGYVEDWS